MDRMTKSMKLWLPFLLCLWMLAGCRSPGVESAIDWDQPTQILVLEGASEWRPPLYDQLTMARILRESLALMRRVELTYPTSRYRLRVTGTARDGAPIEDVLFLGEGWIGDGIGAATLSEEDSRELIELIEAARAAGETPLY